MVLKRFRKKEKTREEMQAEIDSLIEDESRLDMKIGRDKIRKRIAQKRRSQSTMGRVGRDIGSVAERIFGGPPPQPRKTTKKKTKKRKPTKPKKKKKEEHDPSGWLL